MMPTVADSRRIGQRRTNGQQAEADGSVPRHQLQAMNNWIRAAGLRSGVVGSRSRLAQILVDWLFHGHLAVPLIAAGLSASSLLALGVDWSWRAILLAAAGATIVYQLESLGSGRAEDGINQPARVAWRLRNHRFVVGSLVISSVIVALVLAVSVERLVMAAVVLGALGALYALPVLPGGARLKRYRWAKPMMIAAAWSIGTVFIPVLAAGAPLPVELIGVLVAYRFLFLLPNALCSDVPDIEGDRAVGLTTIASTLGVRSTKRISLGLAGLAAVLLGVLVLTPDGVAASAMFTWASVELFGLVGVVMVTNGSDVVRGPRYRWLLDGVLLCFLVDLAVLGLS